MAKPQLLQASYSRGSVRDLARHQLPKGSVWKMVDYIPDLEGAPAQKRGGWDNATTALTGAAYETGVAWAPFTGGDQLVSIDDRGHLFSGTTDKGAAVVPISRPVFFTNLLIVPGTTVKKYDGSSAPGNLTGAPANAFYAATYKSRVVFGVGNNLIFSDVLDAESYDALSFVPITDPITGVAALRNMIVAYSKGRCERLRGSIPPDSTTDGDMVLEPMFNQGCLDARSIAVDGDKVIWANSNGVFISDGAAIDNLIALGGLQQYWTDLMSAYTTSWSIAGGLYGGDYVIAILNGSTFVDALRCNLQRKTWTFISNLPAKMFAEAYATAPELYFAQRGAAKTGALSPIFMPGADNESDGNGVAVEPYIELPAYRGQPGSKRWRNVYVGVDLDADEGTYLTVSVSTTPDDASYDAVLDGADPLQILPTDGFQRVKVPIELASDSLALKIEQTGPSTKTALFDIETDAHDREGLR